MFRPILICLFLASASAYAQLQMPDGRLTTTCNPTPRVPPLPLPPPMNSSGLGLPKQLGGNCTEAVLTADGVGGAAAYWCAQPEPELARLRLFAVKWDNVTAPMVLDFTSLFLMSEKSARIVEIHKKYQTFHIMDMCDIWHPLVDRLNAIYPAPLPALNEWVSVGGTVFTSNGAILTGITNKKVAAGVVCMSNVPPIIAGEKVYYPTVVGSTERVLCKQVAS